MRLKIKNPFILKLALSIITLSIIGLVGMYIIANTIVRNIIYENVIGIARGDVHMISAEIDAWFNTSNHIVKNLTRTLPTLGVNYIKPVADDLLMEYDFIADIYVGFEDGSIIGSGTGIPGDDWDSTKRSWYIDALAAQGEIVVTSPYLSTLENLGVIASVTKWTSGFNGMEAVIVVSIKIGYIIDMVNEYRLAGGGYLVLVDNDGEIVSHPNSEYVFGTDGIKNITDIPNGVLLAEYVSEKVDIKKFNDHRFAEAYFMTFPLESTGWTLAAVVPGSTISEPLSQNTLIIMFAFAAILVGLFILTMIFMSILTRNMEESKVTEERLRIIINNMPLVTNFRDRNFNITECNEAAVDLFGLSSKEEFKKRFYELSPQYQPDGQLSSVKAEQMMNEAFEKGRMNFGWLHQKINGEPVPAEVTLTRVEWQGESKLVSFVRDLSDISKAVGMVEYLEKAAFTDALTGAYNRRYLMETAENEMQECIENNQPFSLIMIDADFFKKVNDTYGHLVGDEVLKILVARISNSVKKDTLVARYGGEEFVVTLPDVDYQNVLSTAERIKSAIEASAFHIDKLELNITVSSGIAALGSNAHTLTEILGNADKALYEAKESGRNKVVFYSEESLG